MAIATNESRWTAESEGIELLDLTVGQLLDRQAARFAEREAVVYRYPEIGIDIRWTFAGLRDESDRLAKGLIALGVEGDRKVAVLAPNIPEWILLEMAIARIGAIMVTVNPAYRKDELAYVLEQSEADTLFIVDTYRDNSFVAILNELIPGLDTGGIGPLAAGERRFPSLRHVVLLGGAGAPGFLTYAEVVAGGVAISGAVLHERAHAVHPYDVAQIEYTSGTTGYPKGAMLTHHAIVNNAWLVSERIQLTGADRYVTPMPLFHAAGCILCVLGNLIAGSTLVMGITFQAAKMLELIQAESGTIFMGTPPMFIAMLEEPRFRSGELVPTTLSMVITGGTPIPVPLMQEIKAKWGADPMIGMGMTECSPMITFTLPDDSFEMKSTTVGRPLAHTEVKIIDSAGHTTPIGEQGELLIRGYCLMHGYYRMPEKTAEAIDVEGWLHSGDLATLDRDGTMRIVGRVKDMIIRGGENIYPAEVEGILLRHSAIAEVQVVGVPDRTMGEEVVAFVRLRDGSGVSAEDIRTWSRANMSRFKVPKHVRFVDAFPTTASGKVRKVELREAIARELAAGRST